VISQLLAAIEASGAAAGESWPTTKTPAEQDFTRSSTSQPKPSPGTVSELRHVAPKDERNKGVEALLSQIIDPEWRVIIRSEMLVLTKLGNDFDIRHYETRVKSIPAEAEDYLFARMGSLIVYLLGASNRLKNVRKGADDDPFGS
jgi:hypothetical protein